MTKKEIGMFITDLKYFHIIKSGSAFYSIEFNPNRNSLTLMGHYEDVKKIYPVLKFDRENETARWYKIEKKIGDINVEIIAVKNITKEKS